MLNVEVGYFFMVIADLQYLMHVFNTMSKVNWIVILPFIRGENVNKRVIIANSVKENVSKMSVKLRGRGP